MKPMLKAAFFSAVKSLLKNGVKPTFRAANFGKLGLIEFIGTNGNNHVEQVYSCAWYSAERMSARFQGWFDAAVAEFNAEVAERLDLNDKVMHGDTIRTVTGFRNDIISSSNGTPREYKRTGVLILDNSIEVMASDVTLIEEQSTSSESAATEPEDILPEGELVIDTVAYVAIKQKYPLDFVVLGNHVFVGAVHTTREFDTNYYLGADQHTKREGQHVYLRVPGLSSEVILGNPCMFHEMPSETRTLLTDVTHTPVGGVKRLRDEVLGEVRS